VSGFFERHHTGSTVMDQDGRGGRDGSAIVAVLSVLALLSLMIVSLLHSIRVEHVTTSAALAEEQANLSAESGVSAAFALLSLATSNRPSYLVGFAPGETENGAQPALVIGATNLTQTTQLAPLFSCDPKELTTFPKLSKTTLAGILESRLSTNPEVAIDLNDAALLESPAEKTNAGGMIASTGRYPALWEKVRDSTGRTVGRYAFILTDETARLNPALHLGKTRNDPVDWDGGPGDLPLTNATGSLFSPEEARELRSSASNLPTLGSLATAFSDAGTYASKRTFLTRDPCLVPDLIPPGLPEAGLPKYNLNDLATNTAWGATPYARATNFAAIIDRILPRFKERDVSLSYRDQGTGLDRSLYSRRLACSIVDYISPEQGPTGPPDGEPSGRDLVPYVTQIAECCTRRELTSNSVTIESRFFAEIWNPTTSTIPAGAARLVIGNRARLIFGTGIDTAFEDYDRSGSVPALRPNEFTVVAFDPVSQTWQSPSAVPFTNAPRWDCGPTGNRRDAHQTFEFYWNGRLSDRSRPAQLFSGKDAGGLLHQAKRLDNDNPQWQCMSIPTWSAGSGNREEPDECSGDVSNQSYRFSGDPGANFLTSYIWGCKSSNYPSNTLWKGIRAVDSAKGCFILDPRQCWARRDRIPVNTSGGNSPTGTLQTPDAITNPYKTVDALLSPFVIRKGPMRSLGELGNVFDPAQVDDEGKAPPTGAKNFQSHFGCGGSRTLRFGQPEFRSPDPAISWDILGKRAVDLADIFTVADRGRPPATTNNPWATNAGIAGRINVNTAPHPVLSALFTGIVVTSDRRFTNSVIGAKAADDLADLIEHHRPYSRLSDLSVLTTNLANAETYTPTLSKNAPGSSPPLADVFDRAREEAFGKIIGHCVVQSRTFRLFVVGEALDAKRKTTGRSVMEGIVRLTPDAQGRLRPSLHDVEWH